MNHEELARIAQAEKETAETFEHNINVCVAAGCMSTHSAEVKSAIETELKARGKETCCKVRGVGCMGLCAAGPLVSADKNTKMYQTVTPVDAAAIVDNVIGDKPAPAAIVLDSKMAFFTEQKKVVLENAGEIDPEHIEDYIAVGGYESLFQCLTTMTPQQVIEQVTKSGLRGRGGAGFPTGLKWTTVSKARCKTTKYVICNADEGDPGAFMDRSVLESDPHRVLEGMAIAAYAVGATRGYIYCRAEYPLAVKRLKIAIREAEKLGLMGHDIGDTQFSFRV